MGWLSRLRGKASGSPQLEDLSKAQAPEQGKPPEPKAWTLDPFKGDFSAQGTEGLQGDLHGGTESLTYDTFTRMSATTAISPIIQTRLNQVSEFLQPAEEGSGELGFAVKRTDGSREMTRADRSTAIQITDWLLQCGDPRVDYENNLSSFVMRLLRDSLRYDQGCFEVLRTRRGKVAGFKAVDGTTIRRALPSPEELRQGRLDPDRATAFVQVINQQTVASWNIHDMAFCVRRPRTDLAAGGYGYPELEELVRVVASILNGETYNASNFINGMHTSGVLALKSKIGPESFRVFRREFYSMLSGASQSRKTPLIQLDPDSNEQLQSINLSQSNRDMEFKEWMDYLHKSACAVFTFDPAEVGRVYGNENQGGALQQAGPQGRILASKEKGLRPLVRMLFTWINRWVLSQYAPGYMIVPVGLDEQIRQARFEADMKKGSMILTVNELRGRYGYEPIPAERDGGAADFIMSPTYTGLALQLLEQRRQDQMQEQQQAGVVDEPVPGDTVEDAGADGELSEEQEAQIEAEAEAFAEEALGAES